MIEGFPIGNGACYGYGNRAGWSQPAGETKMISRCWERQNRFRRSGSPMPEKSFFVPDVLAYWLRKAMLRGSQIISRPCPVYCAAACTPRLQEFNYGPSTPRSPSIDDFSVFIPYCSLNKVRPASYLKGAT